MLKKLFKKHAFSQRLKKQITFFLEVKSVVKTKNQATKTGANKKTLKKLFKKHAFIKKTKNQKVENKIRSHF